MKTTRGSLIERIRCLGDERAWSEFHALYRPLLARYARASGVPDAWVEDLVQECLEAVSRRIGEFEYDPQRCRFRSWLRCVVQSRVNNLFRRRRPVLLGSGDLAVEPTQENSPEELFDRIWLDEHLWYCLSRVREQIKPSTAAAFDMYVLQERPVQQVCTVLGMTANQVYRIKWRVTAKLREELRAILGDEADDWLRQGEPAPSHR